MNTTKKSAVNLLYRQVGFLYGYSGEWKPINSSDLHKILPKRLTEIIELRLVCTHKNTAWVDTGNKECLDCHEMIDIN